MLNENSIIFDVKEDIRIHICSVLSGVIKDHHLKDLRHGIWLPLAFTILQIYNDFTQDSDKDTVFLIDRLQKVYYSCQKIPTMRSPQEKILFSLFHLSVGTSQHCHLHVNEAGQSICSGRMVVEVKFCCLGLVEPARARLWFRHKWKRNRFREWVNEQSQESAIVMIELGADEVLNVLTQIRFLGQEEWEEEWGTTSGQPRAITKWGRLWSRGGSFMIVKNEAVETYDMTAHRFELATSDGIRRC